MLNNVLQNISKFLINVFDFLTFRKNNVVLNNDIESCLMPCNDTSDNDTSDNYLVRTFYE